MPFSSILADNDTFLQQAQALTRSLTPSQYTHTHPLLYRHGAGPHFRHCMDHYALFLQGVPGGRVNYDHRERGGEAQSDPLAMADWIQELREGLLSLSDTDLHTPLKVQMDCGGEDQQTWSDSSVFRELQFLISHTVHHFALIAIILRDQEIDIPEDFGVAPSTRRYEQSRSCAQ
jgi:hypothetical protein